MIYVNPRRRRGGRRRSRRNPESHRERVRAAKKGWARRRSRHNPESYAERSAAAKRGWSHRRHHRVRRNAFYGHSAAHSRAARMEPESERRAAARLGWSHRRRHRRNPPAFLGGVMEDLKTAGIGIAGAFGVNAVGHYVNEAAAITDTTLQSVVKLLVAVVPQFFRKQIGTKTADELTAGALTVIGYNLVTGLLPASVTAMLSLDEPKIVYPSGMGVLMPGSSQPALSAARTSVLVPSGLSANRPPVN